jgi:hypothetical protein
MEYDRAVKDLKNIRTTMDRSVSRISKDSGWFFIVQGAIYLVGYLVTQFAPSAAGPLWIALNAAGIAAMILLGAVLYGRKSRQKHPGLAPRIVATALGVVVFDALLILLLRISEPRDVTILIMLSVALCYVLIGVYVRLLMCVMGALLGAVVAAAAVLWPSFLYFSIAVFGGGVFIGSGIAVLLGKEKADA